MILKIVNKSHSPHMLETKKKEKILREYRCGTSQIPPKIKLENFHNSRVLELGEIMCTLVSEGFGVFIIGRVNIRSLA